MAFTNSHLMKSALIALLLSSMPWLAWSQSDSVLIVSSITEEKAKFEQDSFLIVRINQSLKTKGLSQNVSSDFLLEFSPAGFDTLIEGVKGFEEISLATPTDLLNEYLNKRKMNEDEESDYEREFELREEYALFFSIDYLGEGVFVISDGHWEYTGGAHGYGKAAAYFFDAGKRKMFEYSDVFKSGFEDFVYERVKKELIYDGLFGGYTEEQADSLTEGNRGLSAYEYNFSDKYFIVKSQSYETLYGIFYGGYPGLGVDIPYKDLKSFIIKDSPIWRLYKAKK
jgi:hypothetical protein